VGFVVASTIAEGAGEHRVVRGELHSLGFGEWLFVRVLVLLAAPALSAAALTSGIGGQRCTLRLDVNGGRGQRDALLFGQEARADLVRRDGVAHGRERCEDGLERRSYGIDEEDAKEVVRW
jgi:hypothetical protein